MINLFKKYLLNKKFIIWYLILFVAIYFVHSMVINEKLGYMSLKNIIDNIYLFYVLLLPLSFSDLALFGCLIIDCLFMCILFYMITNFTDLFFTTCSTITLTRIKRQKWLNKVFIINFIYTLILAISYIIFFIVILYKKDIITNFKTIYLIPIIYKIILTTLLPNLYLAFYLKSDSIPISIIGSSTIYIFLELVIKFSFVEATVKFNYVGLIILLLILTFISLYYIIKSSFERRDIS